MGNGNRDVELTIRARNEASKALDAVTSALSDLTKAQEKAGEGAGKTGSLLTQLGSELNKLQQQIGGSTAVDKIATSMDRAAGAVGRLEASITKANGEAARLQGEIAKSEQAVAGFATETERLKAALEQQKTAASGAQKEFAKLSGELKSAEAIISGSAAKSQKYVDSIGKQESALAKTAQKHRELAGAILAAESPSAKLLDSFEKTDAKLRSQASTLAKTKVEYRDFLSSVTSLSSSIPRLREAVASSEAAFKAAENTQRQTALTLKEVEASSRTAAKNLSGLRDAAAKNADALSRQSVALEKARADLAEIGAVAEQARRKTAELDNAAFRKVADDAARLNKASEYVRWWTQALDAADKAEDKLAGNTLGMGNRASGLQSAASAARQLATSANDAGNAMGNLESHGRKALSWAQRMRSEVIALGASFVGVYAAITQLQSVVQTTIELEAVNNRMNVAFGGNQQQVASAMRFVNSEADRLGINVRTLATEYSKFATATTGTNLAGEQTNKIFRSLAEAFRSNNLTTAQTELAFNAITQMVNKGTVSMEELRQQLGERLPGAFELAAKSMGMTTGEFSKLVAEGKIATQDFLPKFASQLDSAFGPGLNKAISGTAAAIGKYETAVIRLQDAFAKGGFIEGFVEGLDRLTTVFESRSGKDFFAGLGAAIGGAVKAMAFLIDHSKTLLIVLSPLIGRAIVAGFIALGKSVGTMLTSFKPLPLAVQQATSSVNAFSGACGAAFVQTTKFERTLIAMKAQAGLAGVAATTLTRTLSVLRGVLAGLGGLPGIILTGLSVAFTYWITRTGEATDALAEHERQMQAVLDSYNQAKDKAGDWAKAVKDVSLAGAEKNLGELAKNLEAQIEPIAQQIAGKLGGMMFLDRGEMGEIGKQISTLTKDLMEGRTTVSAYARALDDILKGNDVPDRVKQVIRASSDLVAEAVKTEKALSAQSKIVQKLGGDASSVAPQIRELTGALEQMAKGVADASTGAGKSLDQIFDEARKKLEENLDAMKGKVPELAEEMKLLEQMKEIDEILNTTEAIVGLDKTSAAYKQLLEIAKRAKSELQIAFDQKQFQPIANLLAGADSSGDASARLLRQFEGFRSTPYYDVNAYRAGFGSDTVTLADGSIQKVVQGMKVSVADANRDLVRRIGEFQNVIKGQIGTERFNSFSAEQQAALTSVAYNYGSLPKRIIEAVRTGTSAEIATAIRSLSGDNGGINAKRRNTEAFIFEQGSSDEAQSRNIERQIAAADQRSERERQYHEELSRTLDLKAQEAEAGKQRSLEQEIQLALTKAENDAKKAGTALTEAEKQKIIETTTVTWQRKAAEDAITENKKKQEEMEQRLNLLQQHRRDLIQQMELAQERGDTAGYAALQGQLQAVDEKLKQAIADMIAFWQASSDPEKASAAIANLELIRQGLGKVGQQGQLTAQDVSSFFQATASSALDGFVDRIRETGDIFGSLRESFRTFLSDFLAGMAKAILQMALFNAIKAAGNAAGGIWGSIVSAVAGSQAHTGGVVGSGLQSRSVSPAWFGNAVRYHSGGIAGLKPNEVPTILEKGEEVLTENDPRHINNGGGVSSTPIKIINTIDSGSMISEGLSTQEGERAFFNMVRANKASLKQILG